MIYRPKEINELRTPVQLLKPTYSEYNGVKKATYPASGDVLFVNWKSYGGTEQNVNGVFSVIDTAAVVTWYRSDITSDSRLKLENGTIYSIIGEPENIEMQGVFCRFKVERVKGGA
ncbi:MAG: hypothetical protein II574_05530 [Ruminococcus sp.]|nr:hypothetical protein [Ruminococcus sp.]